MIIAIRMLNCFADINQILTANEHARAKLPENCQSAKANDNTPRSIQAKKPGKTWLFLWLPLLDSNQRHCG